MHPDEDAPPQAPEKPDPADCCGGGCVTCVYDIYETARERYQEKMAAWRARHSPEERQPGR